MRALAYLSGSVIALAATAGQMTLPAPLTRDLDILGKAPSLTVVYTVKVGADAPAPYKLVVSRPGAFRLTTPGGFVTSDGATVTTYLTATKKYSAVPYGPSALLKIGEAAAWGPFFGKDAMPEYTTATVGASRTIGGNAVTEVKTETKSGAPVTLFIDKKLGVVRGWTVKNGETETLVLAKTIEIGKAPLPADTFAFVPPEGSSKEAPAVTYAQVHALVMDRCMGCHSTAGHRAGVVLDTYDGVKATVVPGDPAGSLLVKSVRGDGVRKMPLGNHMALTEDEIQQWQSWILAGAKQD